MSAGAGDGERKRGDREGLWPVLIAAPLMVACCAGPLLAGAIGTWALTAWRWRGPGTLALGLALAATGTLILLRRRALRAGCCAAPRAALVSAALRQAASRGGPGYPMSAAVTGSVTPDRPSATGIAR